MQIVTTNHLHPSGAGEDNSQQFHVTPWQPSSLALVKKRNWAYTGVFTSRGSSHTPRQFLPPNSGSSRDKKVFYLTAPFEISPSSPHNKMDSAGSFSAVQEGAKVCAYKENVGVN